jgi:SAM-dependent methyltransferase
MEYFHGYSQTEQKRLVAQAELFEPYIHENMNFNQEESILEVGCGVGVQIKTILKRHKVAKITGIDLSDEQINKAKLLLANEIQNGIVEVFSTSSEKMPFDDNSFDSIYITFVLEHVLNPSTLLAEVKRILKPNGKFYCTEPFNSSLYIYPKTEYLIEYWKCLNRLRKEEFLGDPNIGIKLPNLFINSGFTIDIFTAKEVILDKRNTTEHTRFLKWFKEMLLSSYDLLLDRQLVSADANEQISLEIDRLGSDPETIFLLNFRQILARK